MPSSLSPVSLSSSTLILNHLFVVDNTYSFEGSLKSRFARSICLHCFTFMSQIMIKKFPFFRDHLDFRLVHELCQLADPMASLSSLSPIRLAAWWLRWVVSLSLPDWLGLPSGGRTTSLGLGLWLLSVCPLECRLLLLALGVPFLGLDLEVDLDLR